MCTQWRNALQKVHKLHWFVKTNVIPLIAECVPIDVALIFRLIKFHRSVAFSDNTVVNNITNTINRLYVDFTGSRQLNNKVYCI